MRFIWTVYVRLFGWNTTTEFPYHAIRKYVLIIGPHTSNWDFIIGIAYRSILGLGKTKFLGKKELFRPPFGALFRAIGGEGLRSIETIVIDWWTR